MELLPGCLPQPLQGHESIGSKVKSFKVGHLDSVDGLHRSDVVASQVDPCEVGEVDGLEAPEDGAASI